LQLVQIRDNQITCKNWSFFNASGTLFATDYFCTKNIIYKALIRQRILLIALSGQKNLLSFFVKNFIDGINENFSVY